MKKRLFIALVLMPCIGVTGCISLQSADAEPTITPDQIATSAPEQTAEETSAPEELPEAQELAAAEPPASDAAYAASPAQGTLPGLTVHYP